MDAETQLNYENRVRELFFGENPKRPSENLEAVRLIAILEQIHDRLEEVVNIVSQREEDY